MSLPPLEPCAVQQRWQAAGPLTGEAWQALLAGYLDTLARACDAAGPCVIGHIKALALLEGGGYLRISAVSAKHAPTLDGRVPDGLAALSLTLNVHVYGLSAATLRALAWEAATKAGERAGIHVTEEAPGDPQPHAGPDQSNR